MGFWRFYFVAYNATLQRYNPCGRPPAEEARAALLAQLAADAKQLEVQHAQALAAVNQLLMLYEEPGEGVKCADLC